MIQSMKNHNYRYNLIGRTHYNHHIQRSHRLHHYLWCMKITNWGLELQLRITAKPFLLLP